MDTELKDKLLQLENQVSVVKDATLRRIAFEKLLDGVVGLQNRGASSRGKRPERSNIPPGRSGRIKSKASAFYSVGQVREPVQKLALTGTSKGLPNFKVCRKDWEKVLWVLDAAKRSKIDGLNNHEVAYLLTKRLYKPTKYSTVNNVRKKVGSGLVCLDPETQRWLITPDGEEHLASLTAK
jgi:hypothetical protein